MIKIAIYKAKQLNHSRIWICLIEQNTKALEWYRKLNFNFLKQEPFTMGETKVNHLIGFKSI